MGGAAHRGEPAATRIQSTDGSAEMLKRSAELDALQIGITRSIADEKTDLTCTYLPGLDPVQHALFAEGTPTASAAAERLAALERYYVVLDALLAPLIKPGPGEIVLVVASPGRVQNNASGLFVATGDAANSQLTDGTARPTDVMPTVLHALGIPISRELAGRPLVEMFSAAFARRSPGTGSQHLRIADASRSPRTGQPLDQEMIDRLRSLGYVR